MSKDRIVVATRAFSNNKFLREEMLKLFPNTKFNLEGEKLRDQALVDFIGDAKAVIIGLEPVDAKLLAKVPNLGIVAKYGVGLDNININDCKQNGVEVGWEAGVNKLSVAEMTLGFMLGLARNLYKSSYQLSSGNWIKNGGFQLSEKTIGIIGVGNIGREVIRLLKPFNCTILVNDIINQDEYYLSNNVQHFTKEELIQRSDLVSVHTPLNDEMRNFFNYEIFKQFKKGAYFINTARGGIVSQDDLTEAIEDGLIAGAAIDVYEDEPVEDICILYNDSIINTPHIGGNSEEAVVNMGLSAIKHLKKYFNKK